jgi:hypothetical protein
MIIPDCRMNEGSLRFWEAQYDVMIPVNMMNSPHGWTAWRIFGFYYMYQLTGLETWLQRAMNSLGACMQLVDGHTGRLRWAFAPDPYIAASVLHEDPNDPANPAGRRTDRVINEQYVEMISQFFHPPVDKATGGHWGEGGSCDNDVHEIFKALEEVALTAAYVLERADGTLISHNCMVSMDGDVLKITPAEPVVSRVHLNLRKKRRISVSFGAKKILAEAEAGLQWIGPGGVPEDLR